MYVICAGALIVRSGYCIATIMPYLAISSHWFSSPGWQICRWTTERASNLFKPMGSVTAIASTSASENKVWARPLPYSTQPTWPIRLRITPQCHTASLPIGNYVDLVTLKYSVDRAMDWHNDEGFKTKAQAVYSSTHVSTSPTVKRTFTHCLIYSYYSLYITASLETTRVSLVMDSCNKGIS